MGRRKKERRGSGQTYPLEAAGGARSPIGTPPLGGGFGTNGAEFGFR
jgi:hypothetical protein